jgi:hypothetical protein
MTTGLAKLLGQDLEAAYGELLEINNELRKLGPRAVPRDLRARLYALEDLLCALGHSPVLLLRADDEENR